MNKSLQVLCYAITFALALWVGIFFLFLVASEQFTTRQYLPGKPLPGVLLFYFHNPNAVPYLFSVPWLLFAGLPLFPYVRTPYWDLNFFVLRFCVFFSLEMSLIVFSAIAFYSPWMEIDGGMSDADVAERVTWIESAVRGAFWLGVALFIMALVRRAMTKSKAKQ